ncbi:MAG: secondary thiamine-phosphate synthase enzyme YjbQ [Gammaproteobacteria bacterium]|nr:YjbQ family protein [Rhodocyclaceae bacterium]MBU3908057.1 secondary thiamine-phosphate synthase enzyme YjbQ [Gammaproteobacteria bacterium]MBU3990332.1 secondary thiamine-phosphate synthase enzyme YjbQ [Gammaproteobacteria bacterium]MBU4006014.1 secondary thiamine-phosphate synthase enzyme YjbQ [Gammaproteobacteria bacterium]MBU4022013.1 secondary thiamine-phosphate synthase enzyme YjbQ [Gammaproteobacteria bacterium]
MKQATTKFEVHSSGRGLFEITSELRDFQRQSGIRSGLLTVFCRHTSASLLIQENADPDVRHDLEAFFSRLSPDGQPGWRHNNEGPDDMSGHIRTALTQTSVGIPVVDGELVLGTWQGVFLWEHRTRAHRREVVLHLSGE